MRRDFYSGAKKRVFPLSWIQEDLRHPSTEPPCKSEKNCRKIDSIDALTANREKEKALPFNRILLLSSRVQEKQALFAAQKENVHVVEFDWNSSSLTALRQKLKRLVGNHKLDSIAFMTHAEEGSFALNAKQPIDLHTLAARPEQQRFWKQVGNLVSKTGRIDLLGCNLAANREGKELVDQLESVTGRNVAASSDITGHTNQKGDWILETDDIDVAALYFNPKIAHWHSSLNTSSLPAMQEYGAPSFGGYVYRIKKESAIDDIDLLSDEEREQITAKRAKKKAMALLFGLKNHYQEVVQNKQAANPDTALPEKSIDFFYDTIALDQLKGTLGELIGVEDDTSVRKESRAFQNLLYLYHDALLKDLALPDNYDTLSSAQQNLAKQKQIEAQYRFYFPETVEGSSDLLTLIDDAIDVLIQDLELAGELQLLKRPSLSSMVQFLALESMADTNQTVRNLYRNIQQTEQVQHLLNELTDMIGQNAVFPYNPHNDEYTIPIAQTDPRNAFENIINEVMTIAKSEFDTDKQDTIESVLREQLVPTTTYNIDYIYDKTTEALKTALPNGYEELTGALQKSLKEEITDKGLFSSELFIEQASALVESYSHQHDPSSTYFFSDSSHPITTTMNNVDGASKMQVSLTAAPSGNALDQTLFDSPWLKILYNREISEGEGDSQFHFLLYESIDGQSPGWNEYSDGKTYSSGGEYALFFEFDGQQGSVGASDKERINININGNPTSITSPAMEKREIDYDNSENIIMLGNDYTEMDRPFIGKIDNLRLFRYNDANEATDVTPAINIEEESHLFQAAKEVVDTREKSKAEIEQLLDIDVVDGNTTQVDNDGLIHITDDEKNQQGKIIVQEQSLLAEGNISEFNMSFDVRVFQDGNSLPSDPADGMSINFGSLNANQGETERGCQEGFTISIDTYNNIAPDDERGVYLKYNQTVLKKIDLDEIDLAEWKNVNLNVKARDPNINPPVVDVEFKINGETKLQEEITWHQYDQAQYWIGARTGNSYDNHWIKNLHITEVPAKRSLLPEQKILHVQELAGKEALLMECEVQIDTDSTALLPILSSPWFQIHYENGAFQARVNTNSTSFQENEGWSDPLTTVASFPHQQNGETAKYRVAVEWEKKDDFIGEFHLYVKDITERDAEFEQSDKITQMMTTEGSTPLSLTNSSDPHHQQVVFGKYSSDDQRFVGSIGNFQIVEQAANQNKDFSFLRALFGIKPAVIARKTQPNDLLALNLADEDPSQIALNNRSSFQTTLEHDFSASSEHFFSFGKSAGTTLEEGIAFSIKANETPSLSFHYNNEEPVLHHIPIDTTASSQPLSLEFRLQEKEEGRHYAIVSIEGKEVFHTLVDGLAPQSDWYYRNANGPNGSQGSDAMTVFEFTPSIEEKEIKTDDLRFDDFIESYEESRLKTLIDQLHSLLPQLFTPDGSLKELFSDLTTRLEAFSEWYQTSSSSLSNDQIDMLDQTKGVLTQIDYTHPQEFDQDYPLFNQWDESEKYRLFGGQADREKLLHHYTLIHRFIESFYRQFDAGYVPTAAGGQFLENSQSLLQGATVDQDDKTKIYFGDGGAERNIEKNETFYFVLQGDDDTTRYQATPIAPIEKGALDATFLITPAISSSSVDIVPTFPTKPGKLESLLQNSLTFAASTSESTQEDLKRSLFLYQQITTLFQSFSRKSQNMIRSLARKLRR